MNMLINPPPQDQCTARVAEYLSRRKLHVHVRTTGNKLYKYIVHIVYMCMLTGWHICYNLTLSKGNVSDPKTSQNTNW